MTRYLWIAALACVGLLLLKRQRWGNLFIAGGAALPAAGLHLRLPAGAGKPLAGRHRPGAAPLPPELHGHLLQSAISPWRGIKTHGVGTLSCVAKGDQVVMRDEGRPQLVRHPGTFSIRPRRWDQTDAAVAAAAKQR